MNQTKTNPWFRLFPSLTDVAFVLPLLWIFGVLGGAKLLLGDGDTGWHIRAGEWMLANGRVPTKDLFSYTMPDAPWFAWEWLWDVIMAWLHQRWGMAAVVFVSSLVLCCVSALVFRLTLRRCPNRIVAFVVTAAAMMASSIHWLARPHLFTLLFTVIFLHVIDRVRGGRPRLIWTLVPLMVLWTNLHGGFIVGLSIIGCYLAGEIAALFGATKVDRVVVFGRIRTYGLVLAACIAATFVNPYTWRLHVHIGRYLSESYHFQNIGEFQSVDFHQLASRVLEPLLLLAVWGAIRLLKNGEYGRALLTIGWLHLALVMVRNVPIFVIVAAPVAAEALQLGFRLLCKSLQLPVARSAMQSLRSTAADFALVDVLPRVHVASIAVAVWLWTALTWPADARFVSEYDRKAYPAKALEWLTAHGPIDKVYTDDEWGDYLIYTGYPKLRVFVDGRSDFYGPEFGNKYSNILRNRYDWERALIAHNVDTAIVRVDCPLASTMKESARWQVIYDDGPAVVLRNRVPGLQTSSIAVNSGDAGARIAGVQRNRSVASIQR